MTEIAGVPLKNFEEPIYAALTAYSERAHGEVKFDVDRAIKLELTPEKFNSARSSTPVRYLGEAATLYVIAFAPGDGTGDESFMNLRDIAQTDPYPPNAGSVPRSKAAMHSEAHLTLASALAETRDADPVLFAGSLDLVGYDSEARSLTRLAILGQSLGKFYEAMEEGQAQPKVTSTVGYRQGERFGDPHAVVNNRLLPTVQVAGFIGITKPKAAKHADVLSLLGADVVQPTLRKS